MMLMIRSSWRHPLGLLLKRVVKWVELGGRYTIVHTCRKTNGTSPQNHTHVRVTEGLKEHHVCTTKDPPCFSGSTCELSRVLPTCHHGK